MENQDSGISPKIIALVVVTITITVILILLSKEPPEVATREEIEVTGVEKVEEPELLFADSDEEFEEIWNEALSGTGETSTEFLKTGYEPLAKWLDERFHVEFSRMTPELIFDQVPLNDIFYEVGDLSNRGRSFNFSSTDISRRELLEKIALFWDLEMTFQIDETNNPTAVRVAPR